MKKRRYIRKRPTAAQLRRRTQAIIKELRWFRDLSMGEIITPESSAALIAIVFTLSALERRLMETK